MMSIPDSFVIVCLQTCFCAYSITYNKIKVHVNFADNSHVKSGQV